MEASAVVKHFNKIKDSQAGLRTCFEVTTVDEFVFESAPEGLHCGIVIAVAFATHGGDGLCVLEGMAMVVTSVLNAAIGVKDQARRWLALSQCHPPSGQD